MAVTAGPVADEWQDGGVSLQTISQPCRTSAGRVSVTAGPHGRPSGKDECRNEWRSRYGGQPVRSHGRTSVQTVASRQDQVSHGRRVAGRLAFTSGPVARTSGRRVAGRVSGHAGPVLACATKWQSTQDSHWPDDGRTVGCPAGTSLSHCRRVQDECSQRKTQCRTSGITSCGHGMTSLSPWVRDEWQTVAVTARTIGSTSGRSGGPQSQPW